MVGLNEVLDEGLPLHPLQKEAIIKTNLTFADRYKYPLEAIKGHRELNATQCPGDEIMEIIKRLRTSF